MLLWFEQEITTQERGLRWIIRQSIKSWNASHDEVQDILQDVYVRVWKEAACLRRAQGDWRLPKAYVYQVARHLLIDIARRKARLHIENSEDLDSLDLLVDHITPERVASDLQELERLKDCFDRLSDRRREAVWLHGVEGRSQRDAAALMSISEGTLEQTFHTAMRLLWNCFGSDDAEAEAGAAERIPDLRTKI